MAAFDFGVKVDPEQFHQQLNAPCTLHVQAYIRQGWQMFRENIGEFAGFSLIIFAVSLLSSLSQTGGSILFSSIAAPLYVGYSIVAFRLLSGQLFEFGDFFRGFNYFLPLFLASLASTLLVGIGLLLILPGIYLAVGYMFTTFISRNWFAFFGFALVLLALNLLGTLAFGVGLLVSLPVTSCAAAIAYKDIVGLYSSEW